MMRATCEAASSTASTDWVTILAPAAKQRSRRLTSRAAVWLSTIGNDACDDAPSKRAADSVASIDQHASACELSRLEDITTRSNVPPGAPHAACMSKPHRSSRVTSAAAFSVWSRTSALSGMSAQGWTAQGGRRRGRRKGYRAKGSEQNAVAQGLGEGRVGWAPPRCSAVAPTPLPDSGALQLGRDPYPPTPGHS